MLSEFQIFIPLKPPAFLRLWSPHQRSTSIAPMTCFIRMSWKGWGAGTLFISEKILVPIVKFNLQKSIWFKFIIGVAVKWETENFANSIFLENEYPARWLTRSSMPGFNCLGNIRQHQRMVEVFQRLLGKEFIELI